ncbi:MAG: hypothetical protein JRJ03_01785 [Deltaproteobacteria bacterium]|nr:hypothetical protein [Deltaproteobacteria bacterium]
MLDSPLKKLLADMVLFVVTFQPWEEQYYYGASGIPWDFAGAMLCGWEGIAGAPNPCGALLLYGHLLKAGNIAAVIVEG